MKTYQGIIFDLDGVLCHTDHFHYQAWKQIAEELGIPFDQKINNRLRGVSRMESFNIILEGYNGAMSQEEKTTFTDKKNEIYKELLKTMSHEDLSEEVADTLKKLREKGLKLAVGSSSKNAAFILERLGVTEYFDAVCDGNCIARSKPDPEVFLKAAEYLKLDPEKCLVVEDAEAGLKAARLGGMDCAAVGEAAKSELAVYRLESLKSLVEFL